MEGLLSIDPKQHSLESAGERTKELAPWVSDDQIERNAITRQNLFWIGERYSTDISQKFRSTRTEAVAYRYTKKMRQ